MLIRFLREALATFHHRDTPTLRGRKILLAHLQRAKVDLSLIPDAAIHELVDDAYQKCRFFSAGSHNSPEKAFNDMLELYAFQIRQLVCNPLCTPLERQYYSGTRAVLEKHGVALSSYESQ
ncbi:hypothetical protein [Noviherbaspirillum autotrophicum]|uniref:Uncharacterized protein n=1 Tax=Noviherbaspirillum autotrophicum TaxID=709839 RepID=A0A0C2BJ84_9BURK|nr:hypothetical protein [Noviherbaspirillum autotrophicum]KIF80049.1 hypothetical protein TSA66_03230 [Noviherbaspirillum autotrophicum]